MNKIERPDWLNEPLYDLTVGLLNEWFDKHVEPINKALESGVDVVASMGYSDVSLKNAVNINDPKWMYEGKLFLKPIRKEPKFHNPALTELQEKLAHAVDELLKVLGEQE